MRRRKAALRVLTIVSFCGVCLRPIQAAEPDPALAALPRGDQQAIAALRKVGARVLLNARRNPAGDDRREKPPRVEIVIGREWTRCRNCWCR